MEARERGLRSLLFEVLQAEDLRAAGGEGGRRRGGAISAAIGGIWWIWTTIAATECDNRSAVTNFVHRLSRGWCWLGANIREEEPL